MAAERLQAQAEAYQDRVFSQWEEIKKITDRDGRLSAAREQDKKNSLDPALGTILSFMLAKQYEHPTISWTLSKAQNEFIPGKEGQRAEARTELRNYANVNFAVSRDMVRFPGIPQVNDILKLNKFHDLRLQYALDSRFAHPRFGIPDDFNSRGKGLPSRDIILSNRLYRNNRALQESMEPNLSDDKIPLVILFEKAIHEPIPQITSDEVNFLRFMGLGTVSNFQETLNNNLLERIFAKMKNIPDPEFIMIPTSIYQSNGEQIIFNMLSNFATFAFNSDKLRPSGEEQNRKTGESFYCHYLNAVWTLWNLYEDDITTEAEFWEMMEDLEVMFIHDILEDFKEKVTVTPDDDSQTNWTIRLDGLDQTLRINRGQKLVLDALTKKTEEGERWFDNIMGIEDSKYPKWLTKMALLRRVARCKSADRLSNLPTMTATGNSYLETVRKLNESIDSGAPLLWYGHTAGKGPLETIVYISDMDHTRFLRSFGIISLLADMEKRVLFSHFGPKFLRMILSDSSPWALEMSKVISEEYTQGSQFWSERYDELVAYYQLKNYPYIPDRLLREYFGFQRWAQKNQGLNSSLSLDIFDNDLEDISGFRRVFVPLRGPLLGGVENSWGSKYREWSEAEDFDYSYVINRIYRR